MRVLWFVNTLAGATEFLTGKVGVGGGWITSLQKEFDAIPDMEYAVAFPYKTDQFQILDIEGKRYYACPKFPQTKSGRFIQRVTGGLESEREQEGYLKAIEDFKPDLVHFFGTETGYGLTIPKLSVPSIIWIQGNMAVYAHKWFSGIHQLSARRGATLTQWLNGKTWLHKYARAEKVGRRGKKIFSLGQNFIGRTDWDRRLTQVMAPQATYHHCDEILRPEFYGPRWGAEQDREKIILLTTIRGNLYKGLETVAEAASFLKERLGRPFEWRVAGLKETEDIVRITKKQLGRKGNFRDVKFLGNQTPEQLVMNLQETNLYVHPSRIDNSPNSVCEAMIMGVPIVSTYVGGIPSLLVDGEEGIFVQDGDPYAMAGAIMDLVSHPEKAVTLGGNAHCRALKRHHPQTIVDNLLGIYQTLLTSKPPLIREPI